MLSPEPGPATLKTRPWGGPRLAKLRSAPANVARPIGESWEFSTMPGSESRTDGRRLGEVLGRELPFLAKLLDTAQPLSVQVHPTDDHDRGIAGKEEAWVVLEADADAQVLAGVKPGVERAAFEAAVRTAERAPEDGGELLAMIDAIPIRAGTIVLVPTGTVHAIGGGCLIAELQQPADCTFRLYDYGSDRPLQIDDALAATGIARRPTVWQPGSPATTLRGEHLTLDVLLPGKHERESESDELIIASVASSRVGIGGADHELPGGALRLVTPGQRYSIDVADGGIAVVGAVHSAVSNSAP